MRSLSLLVQSLHSPDQQVTNTWTSAHPTKREIFLTVISNTGIRRLLRCLDSIVLPEQVREAQFTEYNCRHYHWRMSLALELSYITTSSLEQATRLFV